MMATETPKRRFQELDALRGVAALMVVFFHFTMGHPIAEYGFELGITGVDLFFIISGFVIFMSLTKVENGLEFAVNRISRLYPTYWASVTFTFVLIAGFSLFKFHDFRNADFLKYAANMTMFQHYMNIKDLDGPYWTMIVEMVFYIFVLVLYRIKWLRHLDAIGIALSILAVVLANWFYGTEVIAIFHYFPLLGFVPLFHAGTIFYKIYIERTNLQKRYALILFCMVCQSLLFQYVGRSHGYVNQWQYNGMLIVYFGLFTLFVNGQLGFIVSRLTLFLGKISFALYLIHQYFGFGLIIPFLSKHIHFYFAAMIALVCVIGAASAITYWIEIPYGKRFKAFLNRKVSP